MPTDASLVLIKPDAIQRKQIGLVMARLDRLELRLVGAKVVRVSRELAEEHYKELRQRPFFKELIQQLCGELHGVEGVLALVYAGPDAVGRIRQETGSTNPETAEPWTIRGSLGRVRANGWMENVIHASATAEDAQREILLWFRPDELLVPLYPNAAWPSKRTARAGA